MIKYSTNANNKFVIKRNIAPIAPKQLKCALHYKFTNNMLLYLYSFVILYTMTSINNKLATVIYR